MAGGRGGWRQSWDAWQHDLWTPLKWAHSSHTACVLHFRAGTFSWQYSKGDKWPRGQWSPLVLHSHMHFLIFPLFISVCLVSYKQKWAAKAANGHVTHFSVTRLKVKANRENDKEKKEVVFLWDRKNWVKRDMFQLVFLFCFSLQNYQGYFIVSPVVSEWKLIFIISLQFKYFSTVVSPMMTSLFEYVNLPSSVLLVKIVD